jgi:TolB-like protein/Tfp pilus assembly protein PilF
VQKVANQVRVNVQLINAQTDSHLWAETYDRNVTDIFGVESEIAKGIAESLQAKLTSDEKQALAVKPTNNPEAYDAYLRGLAFEARSHFSIDNLMKAIGFYERAVELDPKFALGWARLSRADAILYFTGADTTVARHDAAKTALDNAQKLQPKSPETLLALGYYQYWVLRDYGLAKTTFKRAQKMLPGSSDVLSGLGAVSRREGEWDQSVAYCEQALALDPRNVELLNEAALTYFMLRQFPAALKLYDRALDIVPDNPDLMASKAGIYQAEGNLEQAAKFLADIDGQTPYGNAFVTKFTQLRLERNLGEAIRLLQARLAQFHFASELERCMTQVTLAIAQRLAGDSTGAKTNAEQARATLEPLCKNQPDNYMFAGMLSLANAALGEKDSALKEAERAIALLPSAKDPMYGPGFEENLALIQTMFGANSQAISTLTKLLHTPYFTWFYSRTAALTPALLRLDPLWDPLRGDPRFQQLAAENAPLPEKSIAVLPLANLSEEKEDAFFADGVHDELLSNLAKIKDLKVVSRTSVMQYKSGVRRNLKEIAQQLGVSNVVEGSVRRSGDHVRVSVQLIDARTDRHVWGQNYDHTLADSLALQGDLATEIAGALRAKLEPEEKARLETKPTKNSDAYVLYLKAFEREKKGSWAGEDNIATEKLYAQAIALDPAFALAYARASLLNTNIYDWNHEEETKIKARAQAEEAVRLAPSLGDAHLALGLYLYWGEKDYGAALKEFTLAAAASPNDPEVLSYIAGIYRRQGRWRESITSLQRVQDLDPRNGLSIYNAGLDYLLVRDWPAATACFNRLLEIAPDEAYAKIALAYLEVYRNGTPASGRNILRKIPAGVDPDGFVTRAKCDLAMLERDFAAAEKVLNDFPGRVIDPDWPKSASLGQVALARGDATSAQRFFMAAATDMETRTRNHSDQPVNHASLGLIYAYMGRKEDAIRKARRAVEMEPESQNAFHGAMHAANLAQVYALTGEADQAITLIERLLTIPGPVQPTIGQSITLAELRLRWEWDSLRKYPRFQKILAGPEPKTVY